MNRVVCVCLPVSGCGLGFDGLAGKSGSQTVYIQKGHEHTRTGN